MTEHYFTGGIFESLAADDSDSRVSHRKTLAVADKRVKDQFGAFLAAANNPQDHSARLDLIRADVRAVVASACSEHGGDPDRIETSILSHLAAKTADGFSGSDDLYAESPEPSPVPTQPDFDEALNDHPETINLEPNWEGLRAWVLQVAKTDPETAQGIADSMGSEAPPELQGAPAVDEQQSAGFDEPNPYGEEFAGPQLHGSVRTASTHTARRPKMCPYHREVTDISLASGDPVSGFNAMAQHAWGANHCQGEFEGGCNFKKEMVTQKYWDDKAQQAQERKELRELEQQQIIEEPQVPDTLEGLEDTPPAEDGLDADLAEAPSAIGEGVSDGVEMGSLEPMAAKTAKACGKCNGTGTVVAEGHSSQEETDGKAQCSVCGGTGVIGDEEDADKVGRVGEALKTVDVDQGSADEGTPKIDKSKIPADGLPDIDTEGEGSPNPTVTVDPLEPIKPDNNDADFLEGTKAVTETQDVEQASSFDGDKADSGSWGGNNNAAPVTSAKVDAEVNPIRQLLEEGFVPRTQVEAALKEWNEENTTDESGT